MPRGNKQGKKTETSVSTYTHSTEMRKGIPSGGTAGKASVPAAPKKKYYYNPHLSPVLRHDPTGGADGVLALVEKAGREPLSPEEQKILEEALRNHQPWLEWAGKQEAEEKGYFEVDPVALSIHERVSPQAILRAAKREDIQRNLFADPQEPWTEAVKPTMTKSSCFAGRQEFTYQDASRSIALSSTIAGSNQTMSRK